MFRNQDNFKSAGIFSIARYQNALIALFFCSSIFAQDNLPSFYADALPLFEKNCAACHQPDGPKVGGITAPMSLLDYSQARAWGPMIRNALTTGYMPPWGAHERHRGEFKD